jgi:hypothetical protein
MAAVSRIPTSHAAVVWPHVEEFFATVVPHADGEWTLDQIKADILTGRKSLVTVVNAGRFLGAVCYVMQSRNNSRVAFITALAGESMTSEDNWNQLKMIFSNEGATQVEAAMRPATLRLWSRLGFREKYRITGVEI